MSTRRATPPTRRAAAAAAVLLASSAALAGASVPASAAQADGQAARYRLTLVNLTPGQPLSPPLAATHSPQRYLFGSGFRASRGVVTIAEDGDASVLAAALPGSQGITAVGVMEAPLLPLGVARPGLSSRGDLTITARPGDRVSVVTMLVCTNDGFAGLNSAALPRSGRVAQPAARLRRGQRAQHGAEPRPGGPLLGGGSRGSCPATPTATATLPSRSAASCARTAGSRAGAS